MVKHVILWKIKEEYSETEKESIRLGVKEGLEGLKGVVPGLIDIHVHTESLESSTADLMLDSTFENAESLKGYSVHPAHVEVANGKVRPYMASRSCLDYEVSDNQEDWL